MQPDMHIQRVPRPVIPDPIRHPKAPGTTNRTQPPPSAVNDDRGLRLRQWRPMLPRHNHPHQVLTTPNRASAAPLVSLTDDPAGHGDRAPVPGGSRDSIVEISCRPAHIRERSTNPLASGGAGEGGHQVRWPQQGARKGLGLDTSIGPLLRALRLRAGRSQADQAALLSDLAERAVTRNEVSRWESERRLLTPFWQEHYAVSLGVPVERLRRAVIAAKAERRRAGSQDGQEDPVRRRQFIGAMTSLASPLVTGFDPAHQLIGAADIQRLHRHTARLRRLDDVLGGADTYRTYANQAEATSTLLNEARYSERIGHGLRSLLAEHHQMAGWAAFDSGHQSLARKHYLASQAAAQEADDVVLAGNSLSFLGYQETATARDGTATATASYEAARVVATPKVEALLLERLAFAHAVVGDAPQADTALERAREALSREDDRPEPDWVFWVDESETDIMAGRCWTELRRPLRAVPVLESVLAGFSDTNGRDKALYLTWLADSYVQAREVEQAADTLVRAHDLAAGVASARPSARITAVARKLARHRSVPKVATVLDQLAV